ncbi:MAG: SIMPL domain-containing protein [Candidatus Gastranaerophilales bacterium]|nr:SIMPL domain-containing protein [Candidatus Gastranaerophilales bacterium]
MKMSNKILIALFVFLVAIGTLGINYKTFANSAENGKISSTAKEEKSIAPDTVYVTFSVITNDKNSETAVSLNNKKTTQMINALKKSLTPDETVKTSAYSLNPNYEYNNITKKNMFKDYEVKNNVNLKLKDINKVGKLIDIAVKNGANNVDNLVFTLENTDAVCNQLTAQAAQKARKNAEALLNSLGMKIVNVANISYNCSNLVPRAVYADNFMSMKAAGSEADSTPVTIEAGEIKITATVTITFNIK